MKKDYKALSEQIIALVGGKENIATAMHCMTRLRLNLKDLGLANVTEIKKLDVLGAQIASGQLQIIIGNDINEVYDAFCETAGLQKNDVVNEKIDSIESKVKKTPKTVFLSILDGIVGCVVPLIPILIGSGLIKSIVLICTQLGIAAADNPTITTLSFAADAAFYFLPVFCGFFAAKKFGANEALGAMLGGILIHPTFIAMVTAGNPGSIFGLPIYSASYASTIIPAILSVWIMSYVEKFVVKHSPKMLRTILEPLITLLVMIPLTLVILAPLGTMLSGGLTAALVWIYDTCGFLAIGIISAIVPFIVMTGMHVGLVTVGVQSVATLGYDPVVMAPFMISNFAQGAACLAVGIKAKSAKMKSTALSCAFSDLVPGISEPGMYGITLRYRTPMLGAVIGAFAGGVYLGLMHVVAYGLQAANTFALTVFIGENPMNLVHMLIGSCITLIVSFTATMLLFKYDVVEKIDAGE